MLTLIPMALSCLIVREAWLGLVAAVLSVSSRRIHLGFAPVSRRISRTSVTKWSCWNCCSFTFKLMYRSAFWELLAWKSTAERAASRSTHVRAQCAGISDWVLRNPEIRACQDPCPSLDFAITNVSNILKIVGIICHPCRFNEFYLTINGRASETFRAYVPIWRTCANMM